MSVRRTLAAALAAGLLLAGCTDEPEPRFAPTETPSPSATESEASAEPEAQSPEEFIEEWVELDREMQVSGDAAAYLAVSRRCGACRDFADRVNDVYQNGGSIRTDGWAVRQIAPVRGTTYSLRVLSNPTVVVESSGAEEQRFEGGETTYEVTLREVGGAWQVTDWREVPA